MRDCTTVAVASCLALAGCAALEQPASLANIPHDRPSKEYTDAWQAATQVMDQHFMLRVQDVNRGMIVAEPELGANPMAKYRTRVAAQLVRAGDGLWDVQVRVMNELEVSEPSIMDAQPVDDWVVVAFDKQLEARLVNEINIARFGGPAWKLRNTYMKGMDPAAAPPARHRDLLKAIPQGASTGLSPSNPLSLDKDGTHLALLEQRPSFGDRYTQMIARGDMALRQADFEAATIEYGTAVEQAPNEPVAHVALSHVYFGQGRYRDAAYELRKALALDTQWMNVKLDRSKLYADPKAFSQQLAALSRHVEQHPEDLPARVILAYGLLCAGNGPEGRQQVEALLKQDPRDSAAQALLQAFEPAA